MTAQGTISTSYIFGYYIMLYSLSSHSFNHIIFIITNLHNAQKHNESGIGMFNFTKPKRQVITLLNYIRLWGMCGPLIPLFIREPIIWKVINSRKNVPLGKDYAKKYCCLPNHIHIHRDKREKEQKGLKFTKTSSRIPHKINSVNQRKHILVIVIDFLSVVISNMLLLHV